MLNVEFKEKPFESHEYMIVNGITDEESFFFIENIKRDYRTAGFYDKKVIEIITSYSFEDVGDYFNCLIINNVLELPGIKIDILVYCRDVYNVKAPAITIKLIMDFEHWAKAWSIYDFTREFELSLKVSDVKYSTYYQDENEDAYGGVISGFGIKYIADNINQNILKEIDNALLLLNPLIEKTNRNLTAKINEDTLITFFEFPAEIKTVCKQYLIYFAQFLKDIGIEAEAEIIEDVHKTLFK